MSSLRFESPMEYENAERIGALNGHPHVVGVVLGARVNARVNHGRWIGDCSCGSARMLAAPLLGRGFWCPSCGNRRLAGAEAAVVWPDDMAAVDRLLSVRPDEATRNWAPPETVADLEEENLEHAGEIEFGALAGGGS